MLSRFLMSLAILNLASATASAAEFKGTVKSVDTDKRKITIVVDGKEQTLNVAKNAKVFTPGFARRRMPAPEVPLGGGLGGIKPGAIVTVTTETADEREEITGIRVDREAPKRKNGAGGAP